MKTRACNRGKMTLKEVIEAKGSRLEINTPAIVKKQGDLESVKHKAKFKSKSLSVKKKNTAKTTDMSPKNQN